MICKIGEIVSTHCGIWRVFGLSDNSSNWCILERQGSYGLFDGDFLGKANEKEIHEFRLKESNNVI